MRVKSLMIVGIVSEIGKPSSRLYTGDVATKVRREYCAIDVFMGLNIGIAIRFIPNKRHDFVL